MNVSSFLIKWKQSDLTERAGAQQHFLDLCELFGHPKPAEADPKGEWFTFERGAAKHGGGEGWADVWKRGFFAWEYKGRHKNLDAAYDQLLKYREALDNPPLLCVCDMDRIQVHTNFTGTATKVYDIRLLDFKEPDNLEIMRAVFHDPNKLKPGVSREAITKEAAERLAGVADRLRGRGLDPHQVARFLDRIVFCLFAEDVGLLPDGTLTQILEEYRFEPEQFTAAVKELFDRMAAGGRFGVRRIKRFDGNLFENVEVLELDYLEIESIWLAGKLDWSAVDASIFGTLFERGVDPAKRAQLGLHYTSRADIETLVEPVVMAPLRREWDAARRTIASLLTTGTKNVAQPPSAVAPPKPDLVAQPPSAVSSSALPSAKPARDLYRRNLPHIQSAGKTYFVTFRTWKGRTLPESVRSLILKHCLHDHGTKLMVHGAVVMPDHVHLVYTPLQDAEGRFFTLEEIHSGIKGASAHSVNKALGVRGHLWLDESFDHILRSDESTRAKVDYVCQNPVRKGLVAKEDDYPWLWREWIEGAEGQRGTAEGGCATSPVTSHVPQPPAAESGIQHVAQPPAAESGMQHVAQPPAAESGIQHVAQPPAAESSQPRAAVPQIQCQQDSRSLFKHVPDKSRGEAEILIARFLDRLSTVHVLDPACGSGNFLYVTLQKLKDLEKEAILFAAEHGLGDHMPAVGPWQLHGIEINEYAFELAQLTVWIGYLQWLIHNGFGHPSEPILRPMHTFECKDAILTCVAQPPSAVQQQGKPREHTAEGGCATQQWAEPQWPKVDFIVGNPPFLGGKMMRRELGDEYVDALFQVYKGRVPAEADLCCYWFEKARAHLEAKLCERAGLLATQGIRGGASREVLKRIKATGDIFFGVSDREWVLDGANVHISMLGFDAGQENNRVLDSKPVPQINSNLTSRADITAARRIQANAALSFMADIKVGSFELTDSEARTLLDQANPHGRPNSDVIVPWWNGLDVTRRPRSMWIIDFGVATPIEAAALYEQPFQRVERLVKPIREGNKMEKRARLWWIHGDAAPRIRGSCLAMPRYLATARVAKHRLFVWLGAPTLADAQLIIFARSDDYFFGVLHSRLHEVWALRLGTRLETRPRYTPTTCFETFPFPQTTAEGGCATRQGGEHVAQPPSAESASHPLTAEGGCATQSGTSLVAAIGAAARELNELRENWLNPPEWVREEVLEFPGTVGGPWTRYIVEEGSGLQVTGSGRSGGSGQGARHPEPEPRNPARIGLVRYPRLVPRDAMCAERLRKRTLTALYNQRPTWLALAHRKLDEAVFAAYGWDPALGDEEILGKLLALNLERAAAGG